MFRPISATVIVAALATVQANVGTDAKGSSAAPTGTAAILSQPPGPPLQHLRPGERLSIEQEVPITIVFVGLEPGTAATAIDTLRLLSSQPTENPMGDRLTRSIERTDLTRQENWYDKFLESSRLGLTYRYQYRTVFADAAFEDQFFNFVGSIAFGPIPGGTAYQQAYSEHPLAAQRIAESYLIDATAAEWWLATHAGPMLDVDTTRPTVFFINWFGRPDFRFHTYAFLYQPPDFPFPLGFTHIGQMVAWGGSPADGPYGALGREARVWFYDVSAGPSYSTQTWTLQQADLSGDGVTDERLAPIWEYGTTHWYRPFTDLTADLAKLLRFVAVDMFFGSSPVYDPALSEPLLADRVELDFNLFAGRPGRDPAATLRVDDLPAMLARLDRTREFTVDLHIRPLDGRVGEVFDCQQSAFTDTPRSCFGNRAHVEDNPATPFHDGVFFDLDLYFVTQARQFLDGIRYEVPLAVFDIPLERLRRGSPLGFASARGPNIQAWSYAWLNDEARLDLRTDTAIVVHEVGHHLGLSHVHDTYDPGSDQDISAADGPFSFMFSGWEGFTVMSYLQNVDEFGQFDRDHLARWQVAARLDNANRILGDITRSPRAGDVATSIADADTKAGEAIAALNTWNLPLASLAAAEAYTLVLAAAATAGVTVEPFSGVADLRGAGVLRAATDPRDLQPPMPPGVAPAERYVR